MQKLKKVYGYDVLVDESGNVLRISSDYGGYRVLNAYRFLKDYNARVIVDNITLNALRSGLKSGRIKLY